MEEKDTRRMIPKEAIEKAIEGGYGKEPSSVIALTRDERIAWYRKEGVALDPSFWQSLEGMVRPTWRREPTWHSDHERTLGRDNVLESEHMTMFCTDAHWHAHRFYDLILTGGDTKAFWDELLNV